MARVVMRDVFASRMHRPTEREDSRAPTQIQNEIRTIKYQWTRVRRRVAKLLLLAKYYFPKEKYQLSFIIYQLLNVTFREQILSKRARDGLRRKPYTNYVKFHSEKDERKQRQRNADTRILTLHDAKSAIAINHDIDGLLQASENEFITSTGSLGLQFDCTTVEMDLVAYRKYADWRSLFYLRSTTSTTIEFAIFGLRFFYPRH